MAEIIDGKKVSEHIRAEIAEGAEKLNGETGMTPGLTADLVGDVQDAET